jgi:DNA polymerase-3 subunit gamma/tau
MSYLVLARKYRPQTFADLIGQEHVSRTLNNAIAADRVHHAFLFTGARGVGKTSAARILAKALNCEQGPTADPCNSCPNCTEITEGQSADVFEIDGASNTGVDDVRDLRDNIRYLPSRSRNKIFIIDEVHMLSINAFNALLKTLEEPPAHAKFIFATTEPHKIPVTILSRCQRLDFRKIVLAKVTDKLKTIAGAEKIEISDRALSLIARNGEGSMRDSLSTLDQVIAFCGEKVTDDDVQGLLGMVDRRLLFDVADAVLQRDGRKVLEALQRVDELGYSWRQFCRELIDLYRLLVLFQVVDDPSEISEVTPDELQELKNFSEAGTLEDHQRALSLLLKTETDVAVSAFPKMAVEMALIRLTSLPPGRDVSTLVRKLEEMERRLASGAVVKSAVPEKSPPPPPEPLERSDEPPVKKPEAPLPQEAGGTKGWSGLVDFVRAKRRPRIASILEQVRPISMSQKLMKVGLAKGSFVDGQLDTETRVDLESLAAEYFGNPIKLETTYVDGSDAEAPPSLADQKQAHETDRAKRLREDALNHPMVKTAIEVFEGEVEEVTPIDKGYV